MMEVLERICRERHAASAQPLDVLRLKGRGCRWVAALSSPGVPLKTTSGTQDKALLLAFLVLIPMCPELSQ